MSDLASRTTPPSPDGAPAEASRSHVFRWLLTRVGTRAAAAAWWAVMVFFDLLILNWWIGLVRDPTPAGAVLVVGFTLIAGIPLVHEWPNARRMGRMLVRGT